MVARAFNAHPITDSREDYEPLLECMRDARFALLGEATHGTREFYRERARITKRLIEEKRFGAVAIEADWPDAQRVNVYVRGGGGTALGALEAFRRFPRWMWRNAEVLEFVEWLRAWNDARPMNDRVGFYGLDLYSMYSSVEAVLAYLDRVDPAAAARARERYACLEAAGPYDEHLGLSRSCEDEVVDQLIELRRQSAEAMSRDGQAAEDEAFEALQNATLIRNAEEYYRKSFSGHVYTWNLRDRHMADMLEALAVHLERTGRPPRVAVWEHNSHVGDARATQMAQEGEVTLGQLARERYGLDAYIVGFTTYSGTVTAATKWGEAGRERKLQPALPGSFEALFHDSGLRRALIDLHDASELHDERTERAVGVVYKPESERAAHYFQAVIEEQFDSVIHIDETRAVGELTKRVARS